jgi:hypothetical protein
LDHPWKQEEACGGLFQDALAGYDNGHVPIQRGMMYTSGALVAGGASSLPIIYVHFDDLA